MKAKVKYGIIVIGALAVIAVLILMRKPMNDIYGAFDPDGIVVELMMDSTSSFTRGNAFPWIVVGIIAITIAVALYFKFKK